MNMPKRVYISADYSEDNGDREVVETLKKWGMDNCRIVEFIDMAEVRTGSVSDSDNCRPCMLKEEFNKQINASSTVIFVVGDKTAVRMAGSNCSRNFDTKRTECFCTPYKKNCNGSKLCNVYYLYKPIDDVGNVNNYSYLRHEFEQAKKKNKTIIILYNSCRNKRQWLPSYMREYEDNAHPFWIKNSLGQKIGDYYYIKKALGYEE